MFETNSNLIIFFYKPQNLQFVVFTTSFGEVFSANESINKNEHLYGRVIDSNKLLNKHFQHSGVQIYTSWIPYSWGRYMCYLLSITQNSMTVWGNKLPKCCKCCDQRQWQRIVMIVIDDYKWKTLMNYCVLIMW